MQIINFYYLIYSFLLFLVFGIFFGTSKKLNYPYLYKTFSYFGVVVLLNLMISLKITYFSEVVLFNNVFILDKLTNNIFNIAVVYMLLIFIIFYKYNIRNSIYYYELFVIMLCCLSTFFLLITSNEFISFYFLLEVQSICFYILTAFNYKNKMGIEVGIKYFILGSISSIFLLLGFSFIYSICGMTNSDDIHFFLYSLSFYNSINLNYFVIIGLLLMLVSFFFKLYIAPFHIWIADIYEHAPTSIVAFFSTVSFFIFYFIFYKWYNLFFFFFFSEYEIVLLICSFLSMLIGTINAINEDDIKRIFVYSSITNIGYILLFIFMYKHTSMLISLLYVFIYVYNSLNGFYIIMHLYSKKQNINLDKISYYSGYFKRNKVISFNLVFYLFFLLGIPPGMLTIMKIFLVIELYKSMYYFFILFILLLSFISSFYYIRIIKNLVFDNINVYYFYEKPSFFYCYNLITFLFINLYFTLENVYYILY